VDATLRLHDVPDMGNQGGRVLQLYLLRHGDAGDPEKWQGADADRPLSEGGHQQSERLGRFLESAGFGAKLFLSSPKLRARQTAEIVARALGAEVRIEDRLAEMVTLADAERIVSDAGDPVEIVLVGHDPDLSRLASDLTGTGLELRKGAICRLDAARPLRQADAVLRWLLPPSLLRGRRNRG
jgi:phosphohistidine phosphatase